MSKYFLILFFLISFSNLSLGQDRDKLNISIGSGPNESSDIGIRFQKNQLQYGLGFGTNFRSGTNRPEIFTGEVFYHFAGTAELSTRRPWYLRNGLILFKNDTYYLRTLTWLFNPRLGREFNISKRIGISLDGGIVTRIKKSSKKIGPNPRYDDVDESPIFPSFGLNFFYRFF